jgi:hypothetical protein
LDDETLTFIAKLLVIFPLAWKFEPACAHSNLPGCGEPLGEDRRFRLPASGGKSLIPNEIES